MTNDFQDSIDFRIYYKAIIEKRIHILLGVVICLVATGIYLSGAPKYYKSSTSFFVNSEEKEMSGLSSYSSLLGKGFSSNIEKHLMAILQSRKIKEEVSVKMTPYLEKEIKIWREKSNAPIEDVERTQRFVISTLKLEKNVEIIYDKYQSIFSINYTYTDPALTQKVVTLYLNSLQNVNQDLRLEAQRELIIILDKPFFPDAPFKPRILLSLAFAGVGSFLIMCGFFLIRTHIHQISESVNS